MDNKWENITREELLKIYVENDVVYTMVAEMFGVTKSQVVSKMRKQKRDMCLMIWILMLCQEH